MSLTIKAVDKRWLGVAIGLGFLFLAFRNLKWSEFSAGFRDFHLYYLTPMLGVLFLAYFIRSLRWRIILNNVKNISTYNSFSAIILGQMGNSLLPARLGEVFRAYIIGSRENMSKGAAFGSIIVERLLDGITLIVLTIAVLYFLALPSWVGTMVLISTIIFGGALLALIVWVHKTDRLLAYIERLIPQKKRGNPGRVIPFLQSLTTGLHILKDRRQLLVAFILSFVIWGFESSIYFMGLKALEIQVPFYASAFVMGIVGLAVVIPSLPGHIGTFHYAAMMALMVFGIDRNVGLVYAITLHGIGYVAVVFSGLIFMSLSGLKMQELKGLPSKQA